MSFNKKNHFSTAIIGSGPAGLTAAIYLGRSKVDTIVFEKFLPGGYVVNIHNIENYPGFPEGISGIDLGKLYHQHAQKFGAIIKNEEVKKIILEEKPFIIETSISSYTSLTLILSMGTSFKKLGVPGEEEFIHKGISFCATCDAPLFEGENVVVIGAGNSGLQESLYISRFAKHITIIEKLEYPTGEKILIDRVKYNKKIELLLSHSVIRFIGDEMLSGVEVKDLKKGKIKFLEAKGAFIYVGEVPNSELVKGLLELDENGFILTDQYMRTSFPGVFAIGNVRTTPLRQIATAIGDGAIGAKEVYKFLETLEAKNEY
ncbi:MAG: FAD-dependent oxidoreductase [candidate division WOR-3 bacterium]